MLRRLLSLVYGRESFYPDAAAESIRGAMADLNHPQTRKGRPA